MSGASLSVFWRFGSDSPLVAVVVVAMMVELKF
jgi:hypothetical protein